MSEGWPKFVGFIFAAPSVDSIPEINPPPVTFSLRKRNGDQRGFGNILHEIELVLGCLAVG